MIKCFCILFVLTIHYCNARGAAKTNSIYGNGNVLPNSYCQYVGLDCSSTCCIQQSCAASLSDCEYGISTDLYYIYYIVAGIVGLIAIFPILTKIIVILLTRKVISQKKYLPDDRTETIQFSCLELCGTYCCCFLLCCCRNNRVKSRFGGASGFVNIRFRSKYMENLERNHFDISETYADEYLKGTQELPVKQPKKIAVKQADDWDIEQSRRSEEDNNWNVAEVKDKIEDKSMSVSSSRFEFLNNKNGMDGAGTMTPQYYPQKHSERKDREADKIFVSKELSNSNAKQKTGRNSIVKENPDSLDSDLMDAIIKSHNQKPTVIEPEVNINDDEDAERKSVGSKVSDKMMDEILKWDEEKDKIEAKTKNGREKKKKNE